MLAEAAKLLKLPEVALREELGRVKAAAPAPRHVEPEPAEELQEDEDGASEQPEPGEEAAEVLPPSSCELAFCEFLLANEYAEEAKEIDSVVDKMLPEEVLDHDFTRQFVKTWRAEIASGDDCIAPWSDSLGARERGWFDRMLAGQGRPLECGLSQIEVLKDFVRSLWAARLRRIRGEIPAAGSAEDNVRRLKITMDLKRINTVKWKDVAGVVREWRTVGQAS